MKESAPEHLPVFVSDWIKEVKFGTEKDTNEKPIEYGGLLHHLQDGENSQNWIDNTTEGNDQLKLVRWELWLIAVEGRIRDRIVGDRGDYDGEHRAWVCCACKPE